MTIYYMAYALMLFCALWRLFHSRDLRQPKSRRWLCLLFAAMWICIVGLRHPSMGVDLQYGETTGYLGRFAMMVDAPWDDILHEKMLHYERGYIIFNKLLGYISDDPQILLFVCALISIGLVSVVIYNNSDYPLMSMVIYLGLPCFYIGFSGLRQAIAIAITMLSFEFIRRRKLLLFVAIIALAATFHSSAWTMLIAYPLYRVRLKGALSLTSVLLPLAVFAFRSPLFAIFSRLFKDDAKPDNNGALTLFLVFWAVYLFAVLFEHREDGEELGLRNLYLMACLCQAFGGIYQTAIRVGYYFMIYLVLLLPRIIRNEDKRTRGQRYNHSAMYMYLAIGICFALFGLKLFDNTSWAMASPHSFFWEG